MGKNKNARVCVQGTTWNVVYCDSKVIGDEISVQIITATRTDAPSNSISNKLYSSLKYQMQHILSGPKLPSMLMVKIKVCFADNGKEVLRDKKTIIAGDVDVQLNKNENGQIATRTKVQFTDVSYHHDMKYFQYVLSYHMPQDLVQPVLVIRSTPFQVFARRSQAPLQAKKRVREVVSEEESETVSNNNTLELTAKKGKNNSALLEAYKKGVEELLALREQLSGSEEQQQALAAAIQNLLLSQPTEGQCKFVSFDSAFDQTSFANANAIDNTPHYAVEPFCIGVQQPADNLLVNPIDDFFAEEQSFIPVLAEGSPRSSQDDNVMLEDRLQDFHLAEIDALLAEQF